MKTIAVIDDDIYIGNMISDVLTREGYRVLRAYSGTEALLLLGVEHPDLILLDLMLPGLDGEKVLPLIKNTPVIILSARVDTESKISLLKAGAADYITKPFDIRELLARIAVQLRASPFVKASALTAGGLTLYTDSHKLTYGSDEIRLTKTEYAIIKLLMQNPGRVLAKSFILDNISLDTPDCMEGSLKGAYKQLRKKLRDSGAGDCIEAVWGIGFRLNG